MTRKNVLKKAIELEGIEILLNPSKVRHTMQKIDETQELDAIRVELFLNSTPLGAFLQQKERISCIGKVGYRNLLSKAAKETELKMSVVEEIGADILAAAGADRQETFFEQVRKEQLPSIVNEKLEKTDCYARGEEAYYCGRLFLEEDRTKLNFSLSNSKNLQAAFVYFKRAALDGCERAYGILGLFYYYGMGTSPDEELALEYLMMPGGLTEPYYFNEKKKVLQKLMMKTKVKKQREKANRYLSIATICFILFVSVILKWSETYMYIWLGGAVLNFLFVVSFTRKKLKENGFYDEVLNFSSIFIWIGFLASICL